MKIFKILIAYSNIVLGILNICKFLYYLGHHNEQLWLNLIVGMFTLLIGIQLRKDI